MKAGARIERERDNGFPRAKLNGIPDMFFFRGGRFDFPTVARKRTVGTDKTLSSHLLATRTPDPSSTPLR